MGRKAKAVASSGETLPEPKQVSRTGAIFQKSIEDRIAWLRKGTSPHKALPADIKAAVLLAIRDGATLTQIAAIEGMPSRTAVYAEMDRDPHYAVDIQIAKQYHAASQLDLANSNLQHASTTDDIDAIRGAAIVAESINKYAEKVAPKEYGSLLKLAGADGGALQVVVRRFGDDGNSGSIEENRSSLARDPIEIEATPVNESREAGKEQGTLASS